MTNTDRSSRRVPPRPLRSHCGGAVVPALCLCAIFLSGCFRLQAKAVPEVPLETPEAPPRIVEVTDPETPPIVSLPDEPARNTPPRPRPQPPSPRAQSPASVEPPKAEIPADAARVEDPARVQPPTLQTTPAQQEGEVERRIRQQLARATGDLNRINYQALNTDARTQFDTAKRFVGQADEALKAKNLVFAENLAEKAAALAAELSGR